MNETNRQLLEKVYQHISRGEIEQMLALCADNVTFQIAGKSRLAGKYDRTSLPSGLFAKIGELSGGTFKLEVHDVMASDRHGMVLGTVRLQRNGAPVEYRTVHVWRIENGKPMAGYEYLRDQYQHDSIWA